MTTEMTPTPRQIEILRHALGWPKNYRNHFVTGKGSDDFEDCEALTKGGLMIRTRVPFVVDTVYRVTELGRSALNSPGELT